MKALTLYQPWASLVAIGAKRIETRSWWTDYRGPLAIHAGLRFSRQQYRLCLTEPFSKYLSDAGLLIKMALVGDCVIRDSVTVPTGAVIATCNLVDCKQILTSNDWPQKPEFDFGYYDFMRWMWFLEDVKILSEPLPAKGHQGLWNWEPPESFGELV